MKNNLALNGRSFESFVLSVLRQIASSKSQEIFFEENIPSNYLGGNMPGGTLFDAIAPNGFDNISGPVVFEIKSAKDTLEYGKLQSSLNTLYKKIMHLAFSNITLVLIVNTHSNSPANQTSRVNVQIPYKDNVQVEIWDKSTVDDWINLYPIDYNNVVNSDISANSKNIDIVITESDFEKKSKNNLAAIKTIIETKDNFAFVLGAGISVDPGSKTWDQLLDFFTLELKKQQIIDDEKELSKKIGGSSIITAQLCKDLYPNESDYFWAIHQGIYANRKSINQDFALYHIARISKLCTKKAHFRVLTYNYDDYFESYLSSVGEEFNILYDSKCDVNKNLSIFHVHGFLPQVGYKSHINTRHKKSIYLTEENYNDLYNHPYSWQISSQLSFFRENICLFVGCGLTDPNIRRLLAMTREENRTHYAIISKGNMTTNDLAIASTHLSRLGIEVIWVNNHKEVADKLRDLYKA